MIYSVRRATVEDSQGIATTHVASWQTAYRGLLPDELLDNLSVEQRRAHWSANLTDPRLRSDTLVAVHDRAVVGFASTGPRRCEQLAEDEGELYAIYLHPDHWSHGAGRHLHEEAVTCLRRQGFATATLWVLTGNARAIGFYRRVGWQTTEVTRIDRRPDGTELSEVQLELALT